MSHQLALSVAEKDSPLSKSSSTLETVQTGLAVPNSTAPDLSVPEGGLQAWTTIAGALVLRSLFQFNIVQVHLFSWLVLFATFGSILMLMSR